MPQHRPSEPRTSFGAHLLGGGLALALLVLASIPLGCGGDADDDQAAPSASPTRARTAADAIPRLTDLGFALVQQGKDPLVPATQDMVKAGYRQTSAPMGSALLRIYIEPDVAAAQKLFGTIAEAYGTIPLAALIEQDPTRPLSSAGAPANTGTVSPPLGDQQRSYVTIRADSQGNRVWTDIYRSRRTVIVVQLLQPAAVNQDDLRKEIAARILAAAP